MAGEHEVDLELTQATIRGPSFQPRSSASTHP
jgi:hypothetical protein